MEKNVGGTDRIVRLVLGSLLVLLGIAGYTGLVWVAYGPVPQALGSIVIVLIGLVLVVTGVLQRCTINKLLDRNTYEGK